MRHGASIQPIISSVLFACLCASASSQSVQIQVSDYHERPIPGTVLGGKSAGTSTSNPTDVAGKTQVIPPPGAQPGDPLSLVLVRAPARTMIIMSPFQGRATIPRAPGFIEVILGERGDSWALRDKRVVWSWIATLVQMNRTSFPPRDNLKKMAEESGFTVEQLDDAISKATSETTDPSRAKLAAEYSKQLELLN